MPHLRCPKILVPVHLFEASHPWRVLTVHTPPKRKAAAHSSDLCQVPSFWSFSSQPKISIKPSNSRTFYQLEGKDYSPFHFILVINSASTFHKSSSLELDTASSFLQTQTFELCKQLSQSTAPSTNYLYNSISFIFCKYDKTFPLPLPVYLERPMEGWLFTSWRFIHRCLFHLILTNNCKVHPRYRHGYIKY